MMSSVCLSVHHFWTFHDGITLERIELEGWNLLQSTPYVKLLLARNRHDCHIIISAKIANLTLFYYVIFMNFHDGIIFQRTKLEWMNNVSPLKTTDDSGIVNNLQRGPNISKTRASTIWRQIYINGMQESLLSFGPKRTKSTEKWVRKRYRR